MMIYRMSELCPSVVQLVLEAGVGSLLFGQSPPRFVEPQIVHDNERLAVLV